MHMLLPTHAYAPTHTHAIGNIILGQNSYLHTSLQPTYEARTRQKHHLQGTYKGQTWPEKSLTRYLQGANVAGKITYKVLTRGKRGRKNHLQGTYKEPYKKLTRGKQGRLQGANKAGGKSYEAANECMCVGHLRTTSLNHALVTTSWA